MKECRGEQIQLLLGYCGDQATMKADGVVLHSSWFENVNHRRQAAPVVKAEIND